MPDPIDTKPLDLSRCRALLVELRENGDSVSAGQAIGVLHLALDEIDRLRNRLERISDAAWGAAPLDVEHTIHSHADDVPDALRRATAALEAVIAITSESVFEAEEARVKEATDV
jgi:hypothetical protein